MSIMKRGAVRVAAIGAVAAVGLGMVTGTAAQAADADLELSVDLATVDVGPSEVESPHIGSAQGILYGLTSDATEPSEDLLAPLDINAFRGGGWYAGGWRSDGYQLGPNTQKDIDSIIAGATRLKNASSHPDDFHYEVIVSDLWGSTGGAPKNSMWPCNNGDCSNWELFIEQAIGKLEDSGINFTYDIWNEPDLGIFWAPGADTPQYYQMWDTGYAKLREVAPDADIAGPSFAYTPERNPKLWDNFFAHVSANDTVPDWVANHNEGEGGVAAGADDPVIVGKLLRDLMDKYGIEQRPLSSNEWQGAGIQTADTTAWYINRLHQSTYSTGMRGNWRCCMIPNLTGLLNHAQTGWAPTGNWWAMRTSAEMTGQFVETSEQVGDSKMTISATKDDEKEQAIMLLGGLRAFTGSASVNVTGFDTTPYLVNDGKVHATVYSIPEGTLYSRPLQFSGDVELNADGSIDLPVEFLGDHDAAAIYLSEADPQTVTFEAPEQIIPGESYDVPVTLFNGSNRDLADVTTTLELTTEDPENAASIEITAVDGASIDALAAGESATANFHIDVPETAPTMAYRLVATSSFQLDGEARQASHSADLVGACVPGMTCEAEDGELFGGTCFVGNHGGYTGSGFVACFDTDAAGRGMTQTFDVEAAGTYTFHVRYAAGHDGPYANQNRTATVTANGVSKQITMPPTVNWDTWASATVDVDLVAGSNEITLATAPGDNGWINVDSFTLDELAAPGPTVAIELNNRCVAGKVVVVVTADNTSQSSATITTETPYGTVSFGSLVAGKRVSKSLSTRLPSIPAGSAHTTATALGTSVFDTDLPALSCN